MMKLNESIHSEELCKKKFKDFYRNTDTEFYKPNFVRKETEEILF